MTITYKYIYMSDNNIDTLTDSMQSSCGLYECYNQGIIGYIKSLQIPEHTRDVLLHLVQNDNYNNYMDIYNICIENGVELPWQDYKKI